MSKSMVMKMIEDLEKKGQPIIPEKLVEADQEQAEPIDCPRCASYVGAKKESLLIWNDKEAGTKWRLYEARQRMNMFRAQINGVSINFYRSLPNGAEGEPLRQYYSLPEISESPELQRSLKIEIGKHLKADAKRYEMLGSEDAHKIAALGDEILESVRELEKVA